MKSNERKTQKTLDESSQIVEVLHDLRIAAIRGNLEGVKIILAKGITVNQTLKGGWTALMYACSLGHPALVEYLMQQGANPNFHKELFTPLMAACASTQEDEDRLMQCVNLLLLYKACINTAERHHITALMFAAKEGHTKVVARLLADCNCDINAQDSQGWTALFWAVNQGRANVVEILTRKGARVDIQDRCGQTALHLAQNKGHDQIIDILMRKPAEMLDSQPELNHLDSLDMKSKYVFGKGADIMLQTLLNELSTSVINNNGRCGSNLTRLLKSMEIENNLEVISKLAHSVNSCFRNSILLTNKLTNNHLVKETKSMQMSWKNVPYSVVEAREVLSHMVRHMEGLYASMSYVRLHMQRRPPAALLEDKHSRVSEVSALSRKALQCTRLLYDEIHFFHQYTKQLEESECAVPADFVTEHKTDRYHTKLVSSCIVAAIVVVILFNSRAFTSSVFSK